MEKHDTMGHPLQVKYQQSSSFRNQMNELQSRHKRLLQQAIYSDLSGLQSQLIEKYVTQSGRTIYFCYGFKKSFQHKGKLALYFVSKFQRQHIPYDRPKSNFSVVFFNQQTQDSQIYTTFKNLFVCLPLEYFVHLEHFIVMQPHLYHKAMEWITFGTLNKYLQSKTIVIDQLEGLRNVLQIQTFEMVDNLPRRITKDELKGFDREIQLYEHRHNFEGQSASKSEYEQKLKFEDSMKAMIMKPGKETYTLQDYELTEVGVPLVFEILVYYFKLKPDGLLEEGLFRKSVSIDVENQTLSEISKRNYEYILEVKNPHIIANLIKRFLASLKVPVIPFDAFDKLMHDQGVVDKVQMVKHTVKNLPILNFVTLMRLADFLVNSVAPKESASKMTLENLAICFAPCLMRAEKVSMADLIYASKSVMVTKIILKSFEEIFGDAKERDKFLRFSYKQQKKQFQQEIDISIQNAAQKKIQSNKHNGQVLNQNPNNFQLVDSD